MSVTTPSRPRQRAALHLLIALTAVASSCGSESTDSVPGPRRTALIAATDVVILPTYSRLVSDTATLAGAAERLRENPSLPTLVEAQDAWRAARRPWKQSEAFRFGPSEDLRLRLRSKIDWSPANPNLIEQEIMRRSEFPPEVIDALGTSRRGFLALEYLLFDPAGGDVALLTRFNAANGDRRLAYIAGLATDLHVQSRILLDEWLPDGGNFRGELITAGQGSVAYPKFEDAIDDVVGAIVLLATTIEEKKVGGPAGLPLGTPHPDDVEALLSDNTVADILDNLQGIENMYLCRYDDREALGIGALVASGAPELDTAIRLASDAAQRAVRAIPAPLQESVLTHPDAVRHAHDKLHELRLALAVDLVSALGATPRFNSDGD